MVISIYRGPLDQCLGRAPPRRSWGCQQGLLCPSLWAGSRRWKQIWSQISAPPVAWKWATSRRRRRRLWYRCCFVPMRNHLLETQTNTAALAANRLTMLWRKKTEERRTWHSRWSRVSSWTTEEEIWAVRCPLWKGYWSKPCRWMLPFVPMNLSRWNLYFGQSLQIVLTVVLHWPELEIFQLILPWK